MTNDNDKTNDSNDTTRNAGYDPRIPASGEPVTSVNDPRLTTYALGELDGEDLAEVERFLETSSEARAAVEDTRVFAGVLTGELVAEGAPSFEPAQREALSSALDVRAVRGRRPGSRGAVLRIWLTSAAAILICVVAWQMATRKQSASDHARRITVTPAVTLNEPASGARLGEKDDVFLEALSEDERRSFSALGYSGRRVGRAAGERAKSAVQQDSDPREDLRLSEELSQLGYLAGRASDSRQSGERGGKDQRGLNDAPAQEVADGSTDLSDFYYANGTLVDPLPNATAFPGPTNPGGAAAPGSAATTDQESLGLMPVVAGGQGGGGGGKRVDSLKSAKEWKGTASASSSTSGLTGQGKTAMRRLAKGVTPASRRPPAPDPSAANTLSSLGYIGGPTVDADDGRRYPSSMDGGPPTRGESYAPIHENDFQPLTQDRYTALSTFGIDVDTASYSNVRRFLNRNQTPPPNAVRLEEFINAFDYDLPAPNGEHPFSVSVDAATAPWAPRHRLVRIGLKGVEFDEGERPASNLVFLLDVSGSMKSADKLPLLVSSMKMLVDQLDERDRVAVVTYASGSRLVLPSTSGADKDTIRAALDGLTAGGSTHASDGIQQAYRIALENLAEGGVNRVLLATDGDFNVGITEEGPLETFIANKARSGVFLTVLGFGTGNLQDSKAEILADRGNGNYAYIDSLNEAHKVLVREMGGTLVTIAKDVKIQVEFNPGRVAAYRLLGYENRALAAQDFRDDKKDAGEIGAGHTVTALYEIVPVGAQSLPGAVDLKYQTAPPEPEVVVDSPELLTVNLRYKLPDEDTGREFAVPFVDGENAFEAASSDFRFAAAVASFGMVLRHSAHRGDVDFATIHRWAEAAKGDDPHGDRAEFLRLVRAAQGLPGY